MAQPLWDQQPSPRRGFTLVQEARAVKVGPVVVCSDGSVESLRAVESAAREALPRSASMTVLDHGVPGLRQMVAHPAAGSQEALMAAVAGALQNPRVEVLQEASAEPDLDVVSKYCKEVHASLLVLTREQAERFALRRHDWSLATAAPCDVLMIGTNPA